MPTAVDSDEEDEDSEALDELEDSEPEDSECEDSELVDSKFDLCEEFDDEDAVFELPARESVA